jgi:hypothetical protein
MFNDPISDRADSRRQMLPNQDVVSVDTTINPILLYNDSTIVVSEGKSHIITAI